ncbi:activating transcription factor 7-interacting protein 1-like isoform X2 [Anguilla rostrata]|uniref:activating transcription factor 7-interacting protein 1-like isoform X2 n=1 Tax=Anguilla rostrata TaxID=7938 RepID=UPI0030CF07F3
MDVAVAEEPQKKIFRARKTMKISDRQQLELLHNTLSSSKPPCPSPPLVNGRHPDDGQKETEREREKSSAGGSPMEARSVSPASRSPTPLALSLSLSPSPPAKTPEEAASATPPPSPPSSSDGAKETEKGKGDEGKTPTSPSAEGGERKDGEKEEEEGPVKAAVAPEKEKEDEPPKPQGSPEEATAGSLVVPLAAEGAEGDGEKATEAEEAVAMDTAPSNSAPEDVTPILDKMPAASSLTQSPAPPGNTTTSSPSLSPSHAPESDQEVKEGFLVLSEEEETQGEKDDEKEREEGEDKQDGEKMEVDAGKEREKEKSAETVAESAASPPASSAPSPGEEEGEGNGAGVAAGRKRAISGDAETGGPAESGEKEQPERQEGLESQRKRPRVERDELEAHIELKISGNADSRHKLEKVVQQLVAEQLRVLQLSVFDRSLQELRERVEKIDCATKHQHTLDTLQAKIARLNKKFGAVNQAKENLRKPQEISSSSLMISSSPAQRTVRSIQDSKRTEQTLSPASSTGPAGQSKLLSAPSPPTSSSLATAPVLSLISTSSSASPSSSVTSAPPCAPQSQAPPFSTNAPGSPAPKPVSLQPLLIQLPLAVTNAQGGTLVANHSSGVELVPVTSLAGASPLNKAKTTTATTAFIIQKTAAPSSSSSAGLPSSPSLPQITLARAAGHPGSGGMLATPGSAVSVTSARTPAQCASAVGATSASSLPTSSTPAATGGQSSGATASAPLSGAAMASKTDTQATSRAPDSTTTKSSAQASRSTKAGAVIDLTEDDDDVLVTGVKKAPVQSGASVSASPSSSSPSSAGQRASGGPPPLTSHATMHVQPSAQTTVNVSQRCQAVAPSPSRVLPHSSSFSSSSKSSVTLSSSGTGAVGSVRGAVGVTAAVGSNRQGSPQATGPTVRSSPQSTQHLNGPQLTVHHRPLQDSLSKSLPSAAAGQGPAHPPASLPPLPSSPAPPPRLPPEAAHTTPPQQPQLKLARVQSQNGIVLSWCVEETDRSCAAVDSYHLYAYHQDHSGPAAAGGGPPASQWKKIGEVKALPLPMACTLTQFVSGSKYYFAVRARDVYGRFGPFCEPQCTDVITPASGSS